MSIIQRPGKFSTRAIAGLCHYYIITSFHMQKVPVKTANQTFHMMATSQKDAIRRVLVRHLNFDPRHTKGRVTDPIRAIKKWPNTPNKYNVLYGEWWSLPVWISTSKEHVQDIYKRDPDN